MGFSSRCLSLNFGVLKQWILTSYRTGPLARGSEWNLGSGYDQLTVMKNIYVSVYEIPFVLFHPGPPRCQQSSGVHGVVGGAVRCPTNRERFGLPRFIHLGTWIPIRIVMNQSFCGDRESIPFPLTRVAAEVSFLVDRFPSVTTWVTIRRLP